MLLGKLWALIMRVIRNTLYGLDAELSIVRVDTVYCIVINVLSVELIRSRGANLIP
jgi:hypothetical protein